MKPGGQFNKYPGQIPIDFNKSQEDEDKKIVFRMFGLSEAGDLFNKTFKGTDGKWYVPETGDQKTELKNYKEALDRIYEKDPYGSGQN